MATRKPFDARNGIKTTSIAVTSTDVVANLNADLLDGKQGTYFYSPENPQPRAFFVLTRAGNTTVTVYAGATLQVGSRAGLVSVNLLA